MKPACVITTVHPPTPAVKALTQRFPANSVIVVGDKKTPDNWQQRGAYFIKQRDRKLAYSAHAPDNHYARKNLGYLHAIASRASVIYDTDDDNMPNHAWRVRSIRNQVRIPLTGLWCNVYKLFTRSAAWPRGFSLEHLNLPATKLSSPTLRDSPVQQLLSAENPDVDAIWRLAHPCPRLTFSKKLSVYMPPHTWCPFNSQSTWWWPPAYALLYLPKSAPFRMTDIWRSFIAQRCLWTMGLGVTFHSPAEVQQHRNPHSLFSDFMDEIPGYQQNRRITETLATVDLNGSLCNKLLHCYMALWQIGVFPPDELTAVKAWLKDIARLSSRITAT